MKPCGGAGGWLVAVIVVRGVMVVSGCSGGDGGSGSNGSGGDVGGGGRWRRAKIITPPRAASQPRHITKMTRTPATRRLPRHLSQNCFL